MDDPLNYINFPTLTLKFFQFSYFHSYDFTNMYYLARQKVIEKNIFKTEVSVIDIINY